MTGAATVEKALDVLFHLHAAGAPLGLSEIGRALDLPKSSCHRLLAALLEREMVERDESGLYQPGLALLSLGLGAQAREPVVQAARPSLEAEAEALGETVFLVGLRHGRLRVLDKFEGASFLRAAPDVGDMVPTDGTAAGKLYRVFGGEPEDAVGSEHGESDRAEDEAIRRRGYATNRDAWIDGLSVLGVPIWQAVGASTRRLVAILALGAASTRFDALGETVIADHLLAAAERVTGRLNGDPRTHERALSPRRAGGKR
jgi:IclR family acetate operon transcriptional repressor